MIADNILVFVPPAVLFAVAAGTYYDMAAGRLLVGAGKAVMIGIVAVYLNDCSNQVHSGTEDAYNKPHRPVPAGLATENGLARRYWCAMVLCTLIDCIFGVWLWALLLEISIFVPYRWGTPRSYLWWKPAYNFAGTFLLPATG
jgi:4-hydroxybenzoate polyprenyltransferase